jgi:hypothetical protein
MADDLDNTIRDNAAGPKRVRSDAGEMEQRPLRYQIAADKYLPSKQAATCKGLSIKVAMTPTANPFP